MQPPTSSARPKRGGARPGAGRPRARFRRDVPHRARPELSPRHPVHVTLRLARHRRLSLRRRDLYDAFRRVIARDLGRDDFRVVHLSIQHHHLHLLVEAANKRALSRGMQGFAISAARAINDGGCGQVFAHRYHATQITTARQARNALAYVLNNWRRHREDFANGRRLAQKLDVYSSAVMFRGWTEWFGIPAGYEPLPVSPPRTKLLRFDWELFGRIDPDECPGPLAGV